MTASILPQNAPVEISNLVIFIGGGADKSKEVFGGFIPWGPTHLMRDARDYFVAHQGPYSTALYYGYLERKDIVKSIMKYHKRNPQTRINLVGHSRGAAIAKEIAMKHLRKRGIHVNLLITLDPVRSKLTKEYKIPKPKGRKNVTTFINLHAKPRFKNHADVVALIGGQYGTRLQSHATLHKEVRIGHGKVIPLLLAKLDDENRCAMDYLLAESQQPIMTK